MLNDDQTDRIERAIQLFREGKLPDPPPDYPWPQRLWAADEEDGFAGDGDEDKQAAILDAYHDLGNARAVSKHLNLPYETVRRRLNQAGASLPRGTGYRKKEPSNV